MSTRVAGIAGSALWKTNPVYCINKLVESWKSLGNEWLLIPTKLNRLLAVLEGRGVSLPPEAIDVWAREYGLSGLGVEEILKPIPGVVGLVVSQNEAFVVPLDVEPAKSAQWDISPILPFREPGKLPSLLARLIASCSVPQPEGVPERFTYRVTSDFDRLSHGASMDLAAILAIIRNANDDPLFDRACCIAEPMSNNRLAVVGSAQTKLGAFQRECGRGTLLVRCRADGSHIHDKNFDHVWMVDSLNELADKLEENGFLKVFRDARELDELETRIVLARADHLAKRKDNPQPSEALKLLQRCELAGFDLDVPKVDQFRVKHGIILLNRTLGRFKTACELSAKHRNELINSPFKSYEEMANNDAEYGASLFYAHKFQEIVDLLEPWCQRDPLRDPFLLTPLARVKILNTLARALYSNNQCGWEELLKKSEEIWKHVDQTELPRTWFYQAQGYLRVGNASEAENTISKIEARSHLPQLTRDYVPYLKADLARINREIWSDSRTEKSEATGFPLAMYFQATARQSGRSEDDVFQRFRKARIIIDGLTGQDTGNYMAFLSCCLRLAEGAWANDSKAWTEGATMMANFLDREEAMEYRNYYKDLIIGSDSTPDIQKAEAFLNRFVF